MSLRIANILKSMLLGISVSVLFQNYNEKLDSDSLRALIGAIVGTPKQVSIGFRYIP